MNNPVESKRACHKKRNQRSDQIDLVKMRNKTQNKESLVESFRFSDNAQCLTTQNWEWKMDLQFFDRHQPSSFRGVGSEFMHVRGALVCEWKIRLCSSARVTGSLLVGEGGKMHPLYVSQEFQGRQLYCLVGVVYNRQLIYYSTCFSFFLFSNHYY